MECDCCRDPKIACRYPLIMDTSQSLPTQNTAEDHALVGTSQPTDVKDIVGFQTEGEPAREIESAPIHDTYMEEMQSGKMHDIRNYTERWTKMTSYDLASWQRYELAINLETLKSRYNFRKLAGANLIRCSLALRIVLNSEAKQNGVIVVAYNPPNANMMPNLTTQQRLFYFTQRRHLLMNISECSQGDFIVPFVNEGTADEDFNFGSFYITTYALRGPTNDERVPAAIYFSMQNLETAGVTAWRSRLMYEQQGREIKQQDNQGTKASKIVGAAANLAGTLKGIPYIGSFAETASWVGDLASKGLAAIGFSKPTMLENPRFVVPSPTFSLATHDGADFSIPLSLNRDQSISMTTHGPGMEDEMAISYIMSQASVYRKFTWSMNQTFDTTLFSQALSPATMWLEQERTEPVAHNGKVIVYGSVKTYHTPMSYLAQMFKLYRGSIRLTFYVAACKLHSGRLKIMFDPRNLSAGVAEESHVYSDVLDVRSGTTLTFDVPYNRMFGWLETGDVLGGLEVFVDTPLKGSEVSDTVDVYVAVSGGKDFEFTFPMRSNERDLNLAQKQNDTLPLPAFPGGPAQLGVPAVVPEPTGRDPGDGGLADSVIDHVGRHVYVVNSSGGGTPTGKIAVYTEGDDAVSIKSNSPLTVHEPIQVTATNLDVNVRQPVEIKTTSNVPVSVQGLVELQQPVQVVTRSNDSINVKTVGLDTVQVVPPPTKGSHMVSIKDPQNDMTARVISQNSLPSLAVSDQRSLLPFGSEEKAQPKAKKRGLFSSKSKENLVQQGREVADTSGTIAPSISFGNEANNTLASRVAVGDPILNLRQLVKRYDHYLDFFTDSDYDMACIFPFDEVESEVPRHQDFMSRVRSMYAFSSGGVRIAVNGTSARDDMTVGLGYSDIIPAPREQLKRWWGACVTSSRKYKNWFTSWSNSLSLYVPIAPQITGLTMVQVPFVTKYLRHYQTPGIPFTARGETDFGPKDLNVFVLLDNLPVGRHEVFRAAADDYNCGWFIGAPCTVRYIGVDNVNPL